MMLKCFSTNDWENISPGEFTDEVVEDVAKAFEKDDMKPRKVIMESLTNLVCINRDETAAIK